MPTACARGLPKSTAAPGPRPPLCDGAAGGQVPGCKGSRHEETADEGAQGSQISVCAVYSAALSNLFLTVLRALMSMWFSTKLDCVCLCYVRSVLHLTILQCEIYIRYCTVLGWLL